MRFVYVFFLFLGFLSCDDGDFDQIQFDFEESINICGEYLLYRTSPEKKEALIISLNETDVVQEVGEVTIPITPNNIIYRIFSDKVDSDYFCTIIPPAQPTVEKEWLAVAGASNQISIITTEILDESEEITGYKHNITLHNLVLEDENQQERYATYNFGDFETTLSEK